MFSIAYRMLGSAAEAEDVVQDAFLRYHRASDEIAEVIGKSEDNARQLAVRARRRLEDRKPRFEASSEQREELARRFFAAGEEGDTEGLVELLSADVVLYGDGGGKAPAVPRPV